MTREEASFILANIDRRVCDDELNDALDMAIEALEQPRKGHWINAKVGKLFTSNDFKCSECGNLLDFDGVNCGRGNANYCPNCGAKMESEDKAESGHF